MTPQEFVDLSERERADYLYSCPDSAWRALRFAEHPSGIGAAFERAAEAVQAREARELADVQREAAEVYARKRHAVRVGKVQS